MRAFRLLGLAVSIALSLLLLPGCWKKLSASEEIEQRFGLKFPATVKVQIVKDLPGTTDLTYVRVTLNQSDFERLHTMAPFDRGMQYETDNPFFAVSDPFPGWMPERDVKGRGGMLRFNNQSIMYFFDVRKPEQIEGWLLIARS